MVRIKKGGFILNRSAIYQKYPKEMRIKQSGLTELTGYLKCKENEKRGY
jgi:hypothetical protein